MILPSKIAVKGIQLTKRRLTYIPHVSLATVQRSASSGGFLRGSGRNDFAPRELREGAAFGFGGVLPRK